MEYEEIEIELPSGMQKHIVLSNGDGSVKVFSADEANPEYVAFLAQLEQETN
jgi:hypothetical protein